MGQRVEKGVGSHVNTPTFTGNGGDPSGNIVSSLPVGHRVGDRYGVQVGPSWGVDSSRRVGHEQHRNAEGSVASPLGERSGEYEEDDEGDSGEVDGEIDGLVPINNAMAKNRNNSSGSVQSSSEIACHEKLNSHEHHFFLGLMRGELLRDKSNNGRGSTSDQQYQSFRADQHDSPVNIAEPGMFYALPQREDLSALVQKDSGRDNDCMISGRKQFSATNDYGESLRLHLSDPVTKLASSADSRLPATQCDQILLSVLLSRHSVGKKNQNHQNPQKEEETDLSRRGSIVMICYKWTLQKEKGNKRTPQRFVGRVAVVTTQCLNGWYVGERQTAVSVVGEVLGCCSSILTQHCLLAN